MSEHICLIGFMGCGKSTVGMALAKRLDYQWVDLDLYIESQLHRSIAEIFKQDGEGYFRQLETKYLEALLEEAQPMVISTGGGIITTKENRDRLKKAQTFYLNYPFETLYHRIHGDASRPLVSSYEAVKERFLSRLAWYEEAARYTLKCDKKSVEAVVEEIGRCIGT